MTNQGNSIEESISVIIQNQEYGPNSEYAHTLSRAKLFDMKGLKPPPKVKAYQNLYTDSAVTSKFHERQKFGDFAGNKKEYRTKSALDYYDQVMQPPTEPSLTPANQTKPDDTISKSDEDDGLIYVDNPVEDDDNNYFCLPEEG